MIMFFMLAMDIFDATIYNVMLTCCICIYVSMGCMSVSTAW